MALAGDGLEELGARPIDAAELGAGRRRGRSSSIRLGRGEHAAHVYFRDLTHDYIRINAEYTT